MTYTKLHTPALVLSAHNVGESSRMYTLFTPQMGVVFAKSQGVRELKSRHRYALQVLSLADVSLVRGKYGWKITNTTPQLSFHSAFVYEPQKKGVTIRVSRLLTRLVQGEAHDEELFAIMREGFRFLMEQELSRKQITHLEVLIVLRLLHTLGYLKQENQFDTVLDKPAVFSRELLETTGVFHTKAITTINAALKASQL
jgi:recombinational DNA repair protein (RecF pathway)